MPIRREIIIADRVVSFAFGRGGQDPLTQGGSTTSRPIKSATRPTFRYGDRITECLLPE